MRSVSTRLTEGISTSTFSDVIKRVSTACAAAISMVRFSTPFLHLIAEILMEAKMVEDFLLFSSFDGGKIVGCAN